MSTASAMSESRDPRLSADYCLPAAIKMRIDGLNSASSSVAIVTALFAAVMATFAQTISPNTNPSSGWEALRFFILGSIINNLIAAMCSMWAMWIYADFPERAHQLSVQDPRSWPARVAMGEPLTADLILDDQNSLLDEFGLYKGNNWIMVGEIIWAILGLLMTFLALTTYVWLTQSGAVAWSLMVFIVPGFFGLILPLISTQLESWRLMQKYRALKRSVSTEHRGTRAPPSEA